MQAFLVPRRWTIASSVATRCYLKNILNFYLFFKLICLCEVSSLTKQETFAHLQPLFAIPLKINKSICFRAGKPKRTLAPGSRCLWMFLFILFQNSRYPILDKSLQDENNAATVQPHMCIRQSLLGSWFCLCPCICSQLLWRSSGFSVNPLTTHRLIKLCWGIMPFQE